MDRGARGFRASGAAATVIGLVLAYALAYSWVCVTKYRYFLYDDFDLAIFTQATAGILHGSFFSSIRGMNWLGDHSSLVLFLVAPFYALFPSAITLLVVQSVALGLGAWPVFAIARRQLGHEGVAVGLALAYLLYPAVGYTNLFEFHPETLATPALLFSMWGVLAERRGLALGAALVALTAREDVALVVLGIAVWAVWLHRRRGAGLALGLAALAGASLLVTFAWLKPAFNHGEAGYGDMYHAWGGSLAEVATNVLRRPHQAIAALFSTPGDAADTGFKLRWWLYLMAPLAFLPLLSPATLLVALPVVALHMLSFRPQQHTIVYQYTALVTPVFVVAAVQGLRVLLRRAGPSGRTEALAGAGIVIAAGLCQLSFGAFSGAGRGPDSRPPQRVTPSAQDREWRPILERMLARLPREGGVVAGFEFLSHLAGRSEVHSVHHLYSGRYTFSTRPYPTPRGVSALLFDPSSSRLIARLEPGTASRLRRLVSANGLGWAEQEGDLVLLARGARGKLSPLRFAQPPLSAPAELEFDARLFYLGADRLDVRASAGESVTVHTRWRCDAAVDRDYLAVFEWRDATGATRERYVRPLGFLVLGPRVWPFATPVTEHYALRVPGGLAPGRYALGLRLAWKKGDATGFAAAGAIPEGPDGSIWLGTIEVVAR